MVRLINYLRFFSVAVFFSSLFSCQSEISEQKYNTQETITKTSPLTSYLKRVSMAETVDDNIIDKSSYCTIKLPYTVTINNVNIAVNSTTDYQKILDNINAHSDDNDDVKINFPVTMIYYNYIEKFIENESDFNLLLAYWNAEPDFLFKINCLNINYPITISSYNSTYQIASSSEILNDNAFFDFINNLKENQFIALNYPISISDNSNNRTIISNNSEFENAIKYAIDNCQNNSNTSLDFIDVITKNSWSISYFYDDNDKTISYSDYTFVFKNDNTLTATNNSEIPVSGRWETKINNGVREFKVSFSSDNLLHQLDEDWKLFEFNNSHLQFRKEESNNNHYLYFEKK